MAYRDITLDPILNDLRNYFIKNYFQLDEKERNIMYSLLFDPKQKLSIKEWHTIFKAFLEETENGHFEFIGDLDQVKTFYDSLHDLPRYKTLEAMYDLKENLAILEKSHFKLSDNYYTLKYELDNNRATFFISIVVVILAILLLI